MEQDSAEAVVLDTLSEDEIRRRIGQIYRYQSNFLLARAAGDKDHAEHLLKRAVADMEVLLQQPDIMNRMHVRELYRNLQDQYETFYGITDSHAFRRGDIAQLRADMYVATNGTGVPLLQRTLLPELQPGRGPTPIEPVIDMTMNRLVMSSIDYLFREPDEHLYLWLSRADTYLPMIEKIFAEEGVPDELKYLAMVESGLNPTARSWAGAAGMWQFVSATGRAYDLRINYWVDERLDPEKSTRAAARHLLDLYQLFGGDWQLALAGYNCSPARIKQAMRRARSRLGRKPTFWDIYHDIPAETRNYVPMFIAASLVTSNPAAYSVAGKVKRGPRYEYDLVPVHGMFSLRRIAELAGTDLATVRALNPELKRDVTPPSNGAYYIRLPIGSYERFAVGYAQIPEEERRASVEYVVRSGDMLSKIASKYGVTVSALMRANGLRNAATLKVGQHLIVPVPDFTREEADPAKAQPTRVQYARLVRRPIEAVTLPSRGKIRMASTASQQGSKATDAEEGVRATRVIYSVRRGDTLGEVARKYNVSPQELRQWNDLRGNMVHTGQRLYIYTLSEDPAPADESRPAPTVHRVQRDETLSGIAKKYGVSADDLRQWNDLNGPIRVGQRLYVYKK